MVVGATKEFSMDINIPGYLIVSAAVFVGSALAVLSMQIRDLRKAIYNGLTKDVGKMKLFLSRRFPDDNFEW